VSINYVDRGHSAKPKHYTTPPLKMEMKKEEKAKVIKAEKSE